MRTWFALRSAPDDQAVIARYALVLSVSLVGVVGLYFAAMYLITH